jgi:hypothetical protein
MMKFVKGSAILFLALNCCSCAYSIHQLQASEFRPYMPIEKNSDVIKASSEQFSFLGFNRDTQYVNEAYEKLLAQCPSSEISGLTTTYYTDLGFFSWTNRILIQGLCRHTSIN